MARTKQSTRSIHNRHQHIIQRLRPTKFKGNNQASDFLARAVKTKSKTRTSSGSSGPSGSEPKQQEIFHIGRSQYVMANMDVMRDGVEQREEETLGAIRVVVGRSVTMEIKAGELWITFRPPGCRKDRVEVSRRYKNTAIVASFKKANALVSLVDLATYYPEYYWCIHHTTGGQVEEFLRVNGILETRRRRTLTSPAVLLEDISSDDDPLAPASDDD